MLLIHASVSWHLQSHGLQSSPSSRLFFKAAFQKQFYQRYQGHYPAVTAQSSAEAMCSWASRTVQHAATPSWAIQGQASRRGPSIASRCELKPGLVKDSCQPQWNGAIFLQSSLKLFKALRQDKPERRNPDEGQVSATSQGLMHEALLTGCCSELSTSGQTEDLIWTGSAVLGQDGLKFRSTQNTLLYTESYHSVGD